MITLMDATGTEAPAQSVNDDALWKHFPTGTELDLREDSDRTIHADVIRHLLCGGCDPTPGHVAAVRIRGAEIVGQLNLDGTEFTTRLELIECSLPQGATLVEARTRSLYFDGSDIGGLVLRSATIDGRLSLKNAQVTASDGIALLGDFMSVTDNLRCENAQFTGTVRLICADIGKHVILDGATCVQGSGDAALEGHGLTLGQSFFAGDGFEATGAVNLANASIGNDLSLIDATLRNPSGFALLLNGTAVSRDANLNGEFLAVGEVSMMGAQIGQDLSLGYAYITNPDGDSLNAHSLHVGKNLILIGCTFEGMVRLIEATTVQLDDRDATWPDVINLNGFTYTTLFPHSGPKQRLPWLSKHPRFRAQPYEHLAQFYRSLGREVDARRVLRAKEQEITAQQQGR